MIAGIVAVVGVAAALGGFAWSIKAARVQRVIDLHRDLTSGEVGAARSRFSALMWKAGEEAAGANVCHRFSWEEIRSPVGSAKGGRLGSYARFPEILDGGESEPMRDLYSVLWCFERIEAGRKGHALDKKMLQRMVAPHAVWWDELTKNVDNDRMISTIHIESLRELAAALRTEEYEDWARRDFEDG